MQNRGAEMSLGEMDNEHVPELPCRELLAGISLLGIPLRALTECR